MSKAFEMISDSLNEIIEDLEKNDGKNLKREVMTEEKFNYSARKKNDINIKFDEKFFYGQHQVAR